MLAKSTSLRCVLAVLLFLTSSIAFAQRVVTGKVTDANNQPAAGATVTVTGTNVATQTDAEGNFSITVPQGRSGLTVTYVGAEPQQVAVTGSTASVTLRTATSNLNEVVVTGYSSQRKKDIIGAVSVINTEELTSNPSANLAAQLQGRAAGVVVSSTGQPGAPAVVRIRGFQSFGNNDPLYIIDGVPTQDPSLLNPQDIESIQVLKDATSAAIYGTRAANGVIIVTTRQGRPGRSQITYETFAGVQVVTDKMKPDLLNTTEYMEYLQRTTGPTYRHPVFGLNGSFAIPERIVVSSAFRGGTTASDPRADPSKYSLTPGSVYQIYNTDQMGTNWHDAVTRNAPMQSHQITATGGTDKALYSMGLNYYQQQGTFLYTDYKRYTIRANSSFKPTNFLRLGENLQISYENRLGGDQRGEGGAWAQAYRMVPYIPVYDINGGWGGNAMGESGNGTNPVAQLFRSKDNKNDFTKLFGNVFGEILFTKNLTARSSMGLDMGSQFENIISRRTYERAENQGTTQYREQGWRYLNWTWTNTLNFQQVFGQHDVKVLLGSEAIKRKSRGVTAQAQNFDFEDVEFISLNTGVARSLGDVSLANYNVGASNIFSLFGRLDYALAGKYLFNATVRRDGASVFGPETRYGTFPSFGIGWRLSEEGFMKGIGWLNDLKLRAGFGRVGSISNVPGLNQFSTLESNPSATNYDITGANTASTQGYRVNRIGNPGTRWETTETKNVGLDAAFLQNKWELTVNVYRNDTRDLLVPRLRNSLEPVVSQPLVNIGTMRNQGYEVSVINRGRITRDFNYDVSLNFSRYTNELVKMNELGTPILIGLERLSNALITRAGDPVSSFYGYVVDGFYNSQGDIDKGPAMTGATVGSWRFKDIDGRDANGNLTGKPDGIITTDDRTILGSPHPDFQLGTNIGLNWKNFDFMAFLFWNQGNQIWNHTKYFTDMRVFVGGVSKTVLTDSWTPQNMDAKLPRLGTGAENGYTSFITSNPNSYFVEDGSYLRAKTVQLGYRLPKSLANRAHLSNIRLYVQAQNLFTITKYTGADPDVQLIQNGQGDQYIGVDRAGFPNPKQFLFGLNVSF